MGNNN